MRTVWGNYPAFTPQLDPHRTTANSNVATGKTSNHMSFCCGCRRQGYRREPKTTTLCC